MNRIYGFAWVLVWCCLGYSARAQSEFDAKYSFQEIQSLLDAAIDKNDQFGIAMGWYHWAKYEDEKFGDSDSAFQYMARSMERFRRLKDTFRYQRVQIELAEMMGVRGFFEEARDMELEALTYFRQNQHLALETKILLNLSRLHLANRDTANALSYRRLFRDRNRVLKDTSLEIIVLHDEAQRLQYELRYIEAGYLANRMLDLARKTNNQYFIAWAYYHLGVTSEKDRNMRAALQFFLEAERENPQKDDALQRLVWNHLAVVYKALNNPETAYRYAMQFARLSDSTLQRDRAAALQSSSLTYFNRKKRAEIQILESEKSAARLEAQQQRFFAIFLGAGLLIAVLILLFFFREYRNRIRYNQIMLQQKETENQRRMAELETQFKIESMQSMLEGQESERQRIAHDLHDSVGGLLAAAKLQLERLPGKSPAIGDDPEFKKIKTLIDEAVTETRHIARNLQPGTLRQFGLVKAVQDLIGRLQSGQGPEISFQYFGDMSNLPQPISLNCYRIIQELLQNSIKHAKADEILVQINLTDDVLVMVVEDNGVGFDPKTAPKGMGTGNLVDRVQFLKGDISVDSAPGRGASTMITIPVPLAAKP